MPRQAIDFATNVSLFWIFKTFSQLHLALFKIVLPFVVNVILLALVAGPEANLHDP